MKIPTEDKENWSALVSKVSNGYVIKFIEEGEVKEILVSQETDDEYHLAGQKCFMDMILQLKDYFSVFYSKYQKSNLIIEIEEND